jgi:hypothetical protein
MDKPKRRGRPKKQQKEEYGTLEIVRTPAPTRVLDKPKETCDKDKPKVKYEASYFGGERIGIQYGKKQDNGPYLPKGNLAAEILGMSGCGKTTYLLSLILLIKVSQIGIFSRIVGNKVYDEIEKYCNEKGIKYYFASAINEVENTIEQMTSDKDDKTWGLIVFDDWNQGTTSKDNKYVQIMTTVNTMFRNYQYHTCFITQSPVNIPTMIRNNCNVRVLFKINDKFAIDSFQHDFTNLTGKDRDVFMKLFNMIKSVPHSFIQVSDDKVFIYIDGKTQVMEEVDFSSSSDYESDEILNQLCEQYVSTLNNDSVVNPRHDMVKNKLQRYVNSIIDDNDSSSLIDFLKKKGVQIKS